MCAALHRCMSRATPLSAPESMPDSSTLPFHIERVNNNNNKKKLLVQLVAHVRPDAKFTGTLANFGCKKNPFGYSL